PQAFLRELKTIETGIHDAARQADAAQNTSFVQFHQQRLLAIQQAWVRDLAELKIALPARTAPKAEADQAPAGAGAAGVRAPSKSIVEFPMLRRLAFWTGRLREATTDDVWLKLGALHQADAILGQASVEMIRRENPAMDSTDTATGNRVSPKENL